jgi:hypothetical protein
MTKSRNKPSAAELARMRELKDLFKHSQYSLDGLAFFANESSVSDVLLQMVRTEKATGKRCTDQSTAEAGFDTACKEIRQRAKEAAQFAAPVWQER